MPVSSRGADPTPHALRAYGHHGVHLEWQPGATHAVGDCPFCGGEGHLSVQIETGVGRCWKCSTGTEAGGFNPLVFVRKLYELAAGTTTPQALASIAQDRGLLRPETVVAWGVRVDGRGAWLIPGYGVDGQVNQLYRRGGGVNLATPGLWAEGKGHALHMSAGRFDPTNPQIFVCEGPWDGMALDEVMYPKSPSNVVAVPGCSIWREEWTELCRGKSVVLLYDSDHPREVLGRPSTPGYDGMRRVAGKLAGVAAGVRFLRWGPSGYDPARKSGWDVRDELISTQDRVAAAAGIMARLEDAPREWCVPAAPGGGGLHRGAEAVPCESWAECEGAWAEAMRWRPDLRDALAVMLAVCSSTSQAGNQLFLDLVGSPGSAKTTLCQGLLTSANCVHVENMTKLVSGYRVPGDAGKDCSFLARANNKTWVTCEFDVVGSSPEYHQLMGKIRRIFDGEMTATYGNNDEDRIYTALRTPWIRAGTQAMMDRMADRDQSQLGDRFLRFILDEPSDVDRREIARSALRSERSAMLGTANGTQGSLVDPKTRRAQGLTGGYVDWLRARVEGLLPQVDVQEWAEDYCVCLAELSADLRARPSEDKRKADVHDVKELPTRLARQFVRLAACLAVVLNKREVDAEVLRVVRKVALDTAYGHSLSVVRWLCSANPGGEGRSYQETGGLAETTIAVWSGLTPERLKKYLAFMHKIGVIQWQQSRCGGGWVLTERVRDLYLQAYLI